MLADKSRGGRGGASNNEAAISEHCKKRLTVFPAREGLVSDGKNGKQFFTVRGSF
jgi:hypothetical protein